MDYLALGFEHILLGFDHLLFLLALVLLGGTWRSLAKVISAFTAGHCITLSLATLGLVQPNASWIEMIIAASVIYVGVENFFLRDTDRRWRIALGFGLIHGFGFAAALTEIGLPHSDLLLALGLFNVGVEIGQLGMVLLLLPLIVRLRQQRWFADLGVQTISAGIACIGMFWLMDRAIG